MEPHELAIAALNQFALNTSDRERAESGRTNSVDSNENADGCPKLFKPSDNKGSSPKYGKEQEKQWGHRPEIQSSESNPSTVEESRLSTPPTSTSDIVSSHEISSQETASQLPHLAAAQESFHHALPTPLTAGQKRTADGHMKSESPTLPTLLSSHNHSRKISVSSNVSTANGTKIEELTSGLRTRLSYAMFKVSNGWQSNSIDEIESLASQTGSPSSSSSMLLGRCHYHSSPRPTTVRKRQISSSSNSSTRAISTDFDTYCRLDQSSRTYESFWREHFVSDNLNHWQSPSVQTRSSLASRALAPPAEICSTSSRSSGTPRKYTKTQMRPRYGPNTPGSIAGPQTPQRVGSQQSSTMNPSSQTTSQEQDAIETLIFMSSPGNVNNLGHVLPRPKAQSSPQKSPLRGEVHIQPRKAFGRRIGSSIDLNKSEKSIDEDKIQSKSLNHTIPGQDQRKSTVIQCLLDEMGESSSDEEDDLVLNRGTVSTAANPHRITAGRV